VLVECGFVRAQAGDGREWTFTPALGRIATLGTPPQIVALFGDLHDPARAAEAARYVLASLCDQEDPTPLIGCVEVDESGPAREDFHLADTVEVGVRRLVQGAMPPAEQVIIARHLMQHGMVGKAKPGGRGAAQGRYSDRFDAGEYIGLARVHLGLSSADAEALSMTELQRLLELKFPEASGVRDVPSREQYAEAMKAIEKAKEKRRGA
jgi:hypothetical protein